MNQNVNMVLDQVKSFNLEPAEERRCMIIVRLFAKHTEEEIIYSELHLEKEGTAMARLRREHRGNNGATAVLDGLARASATSTGLTDSRVTPESRPFSLAYRLLTLTGLNGGQPVDVAKLSPKLQNFKEKYENVKTTLQAKRHSMPFDSLIKQLSTTYSLFHTALEAALMECLASADVVITTEALAIDPEIGQHFKPRFTIMEEAGKSQTIALLGILGHFKDARFHVMLGDQHQIMSSSRSDDNPLRTQLNVPLFSRVIHGGHPKSKLSLCMRFKSSLNKFISGAFCDGKLGIAVEKIEFDKQDNVREAALDQFTTHYGASFAGRRVIAMDIAQTEEMRSEPTQSRYNPVLEVRTLDILNDFLTKASPVYTLKDILIIVPYVAAKERLRHMITTRANQLQQEGKMFHGVAPQKLISDLAIATVEESQGGERPVVIFDLVGRANGQWTQRERLYVGASRARDQLILVLDLKGPAFRYPKESSGLPKLISALDKHGAICKAYTFKTDEFTKSPWYNKTIVDDNTAYMSTVERSVQATPDEADNSGLADAAKKFVLSSSAIVMPDKTVARQISEA